MYTNKNVDSVSNINSDFTVNATNPLVKHEDPNSVQAVVQAVCRDPTAPAAAVRILAHKIHSPQEREATKALSVSCRSFNSQAFIVHCIPGLLICISVPPYL